MLHCCTSTCRTDAMAVSAAAATANAAQVRHCCWSCDGATSCLVLPALVLLYACGDVARMSWAYVVASSAEFAAQRLPLPLLLQADFGICL
jgi:hypothetical protein